MELLDRIIYADENKTEIGILQDFEIDLDLTDTKDFEMTMSAEVACLDAGYFWFMQGYEYGGIVDEVDSDSEAMTVTYKGRNARGVLNSRVLEPNRNNSRNVSGSPQDVFNGLISECGLSALFVADPQDIETGDYEIEIINFVLTGYTTLYSAIIKIAESANATIKLAYSSDDTKWHIKCELIEDFSDYLNYCQDNSIKYSTENIINAVNHLVCVGESGHVIHLFTDENGGIQPYTVTGVANPIEDADYILDKSKQVMAGLYEYAEVYEASDAAVENYKNISLPSDWASTFEKYYYKQFNYDLTSDTTIQSGKEYYTRTGTEGNYVYTKVDNPVAEELDTYYEVTSDYENYSWYDTGKQNYTQVTSMPEDWDKYEPTADTQVIVGKHYYTLSGSTYTLVTNPVTSAIANYYEYAGTYSSYYKRIQRTSPQVGYEYVAIEGATTEHYKPLGSSCPDDWNDNYGSYYYYKETGTGLVPTPAEGVTVESYVPMTSQPSDWTTNYSSYYKIKDKKYKSVSGVKKKSQTVAPGFKANKYYRKDSVTVAPSFIANKYYWVDSITVAPSWASVSSNVWKQESLLAVPAFLEGNTYELVVDNFANLVSGGIERLESLRTSQQQELKLEDFDVDIGDLVGGVDDITGYTMCEPVTNMIVKLNISGISIEYIIGGTNE